METLTRAAWAALILIHVPSAAVLFLPGLVRTLYAVDPQADLGMLMTHRGALFLAVIAACVFALFEPQSRRLASVVIAISVAGFLVVYARAGMPAGASRTIALVDLVALAPLALVSFEAWRARPT